MIRLNTASLTIFLVLTISTAGWAATYYVDVTNGNDNNPGTSENAPWKTISKVNDSSFQPGDFILFKRGELWREQLIVPSSGAQGDPITFGAYGSGNKPTVTGADLIENWTNHFGNIWKSSISTEPYFVAFDDTVGTYKTAIESLASEKDWFWASNLLYQYSTSDPDKRYKLYCPLSTQCQR